MRTGIPAVTSGDAYPSEGRGAIRVGPAWVAGVCLVLGTTGSCYRLAAGDRAPGDDGINDPFLVKDSNGDGAPDSIGPDPELATNWPGTPGDHDGDGIPDDIDVDDDNDQILDEAPDPELVRVLRPIAIEQCGRVAGCCATGWSQVARAQCELRGTGTLVVALAQGWVDGSFVVAPAALDECLAEQELDCALMRPVPSLGGCRSYLRGLRGVREWCSSDVDCAEGPCTAGEAGLERSEPPPYFVMLPQWGAEQAGDAMCASLGELGDPCDGRQTRCRQELACHDREPRTCVRLASVGEDCRVFGEVERSDDCAGGLYCDDAGGSVCQLRVAGGERCSEDRKCLSGHCALRAGTCEPEPWTGPDACEVGSTYE